MRKLVLFMHVSLDGYASDSNGGLIGFRTTRNLRNTPRRS
ncbi:hypothetical protein J2736_003063 [Paenibacillus qinlingensis]|uniref:Dihydrofolate reductase n=1 Tax=Paenibacillus qinlingensis TaxID=1837343 RepID=A0ABU1NWL4_9BACL|nr:hypothetical protein [Paenibacillus qinlingensis]